MSAEDVVRLVKNAKTYSPDSAPPPDPGEGVRHELRIVTGPEFLSRLALPAPLIDGIVPRGQLYALTGPTGHGKTALAALAQCCIANGIAFAGRECERGRVLVLAGENPDDYGLRLLATAQVLRIPPPEMTRDIGVIAGSFALGAATPHIAEAAGRFGELAAVFVDTSAAYFDGDDENANVAMRMHASRLRALCELPGRPAVIVLCHPTKNPTKDNLLPRGGGAFLAEVDGNLTCWREDSMVTLHWAGKLRGPGFDALQFELQPQVLGLTDTKGRHVHSVAVAPIGDDRAEALAERALSDENRVLVAMLRKPSGSVSDLAMGAGMTDGGGRPQKSRVHRLLGTLKAQGLARQTRGGTWTLTNKGRDEAGEVRL